MYENNEGHGEGVGGIIEQQNLPFFHGIFIYSISDKDYISYSITYATICTKL